MKTKIIKLSDVLKHKHLSLSPSDYIKEKAKSIARRRKKA
jgi:hypothetical protein